MSPLDLNQIDSYPKANKKFSVFVTKIKKYFRLYVSFFKASFIADMEYRTNFLVRIITDIFWYIAQIMVFEIIFRHTKIIGHWDLLQTRVFLGMLFVIDAIYMIIFSENLDRFSEKVRKGDLDLLLAKPVNSQFMISLQKANTAIFGNLFMALGWLIFSISQLAEFNWLRLGWLIFLIPCGVMVNYCMRFMISGLAVIFTRSDNLQFLWYQFYKLGMRPDSIYFPKMRWLLLTFLPVAFVASVPARALLDPPNFYIFAWGFLLPIVIIIISNKFWRFCLKFYSSASS